MATSAEESKTHALETLQPLPSTEEPQIVTNGESAEEPIDAALERRVRWKLDLTILPLLTSVQFLAQMASFSPFPSFSRTRRVKI
jgi:hypothetical protein